MGVELVDVGRLGVGVPIAAEVAVALVVGDDEDDIWLVRGRGRSPEGGGQEERKEEAFHECGNLLRSEERVVLRKMQAWADPAQTFLGEEDEVMQRAGRDALSRAEGFLPGTEEQVAWLRTLPPEQLDLLDRSRLPEEFQLPDEPSAPPEGR